MTFPDEVFTNILSFAGKTYKQKYDDVVKSINDQVTPKYYPVDLSLYEFLYADPWFRKQRIKYNYLQQKMADCRSHITKYDLRRLSYYNYDEKLNKWKQVNDKEYEFNFYDWEGALIWDYAEVFEHRFGAKLYANKIADLNLRLENLERQFRERRALLHETTIIQY